MSKFDLRFKKNVKVEYDRGMIIVKGKYGYKTGHNYFDIKVFVSIKNGELSYYVQEDYNAKDWDKGLYRTLANGKTNKQVLEEEVMQHEKLEQYVAELFKKDRLRFLTNGYALKQKVEVK